MVFFPLSSFFPILCDLLDEILSLLPLLSSFLLFFSHDPSTARSNVGMKSERRPETGPDSPHHLCILACISQPPPLPPLPLSPKLLSHLLYYLLFFHGSARYISTFPRLNVTTSSACFRFPASPLLSLSSGKQVTLERYVLCVYVRVYVYIYVRIYGRPSPSGWAPSSPPSSLSRIIRDKLRDIFRDRFRLTESKDSGTERDIWLESDEIVSNVLTRCTRVESRLFILD